MSRVGSRGIVFLMAIAALVPVAAWGNFEPEAAGRRPAGPPPEAYEACAGKEAGVTVHMVTPRGDTMTATCREVRGRLVAVPDAVGEGAPGGEERQAGAGAAPDDGGAQPSAEATKE